MVWQQSNARMPRTQCHEYALWPVPPLRWKSDGDSLTMNITEGGLDECRSERQSVGTGGILGLLNLEQRFALVPDHRSPALTGL